MLIQDGVDGKRCYFIISSVSTATSTWQYGSSSGTSRSKDWLIRYMRLQLRGIQCKYSSFFAAENNIHTVSRSSPATSVASLPHFYAPAVPRNRGIVSEVGPVQSKGLQLRGSETTPHLPETLLFQLRTLYSHSLGFLRHVLSYF